MLRRFCAAILLFVIFCQPFAMASQGVGVCHAGAEDLAHAMLHWEGTPHHHPDSSGAYHQDDSEESVQHVLSDMGANAPALLHTELVPLLSERPPSPAATSDFAGPPLYLDGPRRPPRLTA